MLHTNERIIKHKLGLLNLAEELGMSVEVDHKAVLVEDQGDMK